MAERKMAAFYDVADGRDTRMTTDDAEAKGVRCITCRETLTGSAGVAGVTARSESGIPLVSGD